MSAPAGKSNAGSKKESRAMAIADSLLCLPGAPGPYLERLEFFSRAMEGRSYFLGPTGEGRFGSVDTMPLVDLERFDCVTYMESVMALSLSRSGDDLLSCILPIRYRSDTISFLTRNHFFVEDWLTHNSTLVSIRRLPGDTVVQKTLDKVGFFRRRNLEGPGANPVTRIIHLPYERALALARNWTQGKAFMGVAFLSEKPGLDVFHTGFLLAETGGRPRLRHAGLKAGKVVTEDFYDYLVSLKGKVPGVLFFDFMAPERSF